MYNHDALPVVLISQAALDKSLIEAERFYLLGLMKENRPYESVMFPMASLLLKKEVEKSPLEFVELHEIERVVIVYELIPPSKLKNYTPGSASFKLPEDSKDNNIDEAFNSVIRKIQDKYPLLSIFCRQHTHPWEGGKRLSGADENHVLSRMEWFRKKGLNTVFNIVMSRYQGSWLFSCYGLDQKLAQRKIKIDLIANNHPYVQEAKQPAYYMTPQGSAWCDASEEELQKSGYSADSTYLQRGWHEYLVELKSNSSASSTNSKIAICLPPLFPQQRARVLRVLDETKGKFELLPLPEHSAWHTPGMDFLDYSLLELVKHYE
jgi:hypothetical protein